MKLVSSLFAAASVLCAGVVLLDPAVAQQGAAAQQKQKEGADLARPSETNQHTYVPSNFRLQLEGENEGMVDSVEEKQSATRDDIGEARGYELAPAPATAPPRVTFSWGQQDQVFPGVIDGIATKYTMFPTDGAPVRATTSVEVSEAGEAKQKQRTPEEDEDDD